MDIPRRVLYLYFQLMYVHVHVQVLFETHTVWDGPEQCLHSRYSVVHFEHVLRET